jgi:opine dehydrogenase
MAGHLALMGCSVRLFNRSEQRLDAIKVMGGIRVEGEVEGFGKLEKVTANPKEALEGAELIMVVVPATAHAYMAEAAAPHLTDGQIIVLNPGRTGGALEFWNILRTRGVSAQVTVAEAQTLIYASRAVNPAQARIFRIKNMIPVAALPAYRTPEVVKTLRRIYPQFAPGDNVLKTSMDNIGAIFHPGITCLNSGWIESRHGDFEFYMDGITPATARVLEALDKERVAVAEALGIRAMSAREWLYMAYDAAGRTLFDAIQSNHGYKGIKAPISLSTRYLSEDVPMSLVPICSIGDMLGVETPAMKSIISIASLLSAEDYMATGRTVEKLGLAGKTVREIRKLVLEGE